MLLIKQSDYSALDGGARVLGRTPDPGNGSGGSGSGTEGSGLLLLSGPNRVQSGVASATFVARSEKALSGSITVVPSVSGVSGVFTPASFLLTSAVQQQTFTFTPGSVGTAAVSLSNTGDLSNPADWSVEVTADAPEELVLTSWMIDINPSRVFEASQGTIPSNSSTAGLAQSQAVSSTSKAGLANIGTHQLELATDTSVRVQNMHVNYDYTTATEYSYPGGFVTMRRVADPDDGAAWAYEARINKTSFAWVAKNPADPKSPAADSFRSEVGPTGNHRYTPWGTEMWGVTAIRFPSYWKDINSEDNNWSVMWQMHDVSGGLTKNPPFAAYWNGGAGTRANSKWALTLRKYKYSVEQYAANAALRNATYPDGYYPSGNEAIKSSFVVNPSHDTWHYFISNYRYGCGDYVDPVAAAMYPSTGGLIYTPAEGRSPFFRVYHAAGAARAVPVFSYTGVWGSPYKIGTKDSDTDEVKLAALTNRMNRAGYWKCGLYMQATQREWDNVGDDRAIWMKGLREWRADDIRAANGGRDPSPDDILSLFRGS